MDRFFDLYLTGWKKYADFNGRACRAEILAYELTNSLIALIIGIPCILLTIYSIVYQEYQKTLPIIPVIIAILLFILILGCFLITLIPTWAIRARRLHDIKQSGWLQLLFWFGGLVPYIGVIVGLVFLVLLYGIPGTEGNNLYGPPSEKY